MQDTLNVVAPYEVETYCILRGERVRDPRGRLWLRRNLYHHLLRAPEAHRPVTIGELPAHLRRGWVERAVAEGRPVHRFVMAGRVRAGLRVPRHRIEDMVMLLVDWLNGLDDGAPVWPRLHRVAVADAVRMAERYHRALERRPAPVPDEDEGGIEEVLAFDDGWRAVRLRSRQALAREGALMHHCVAGYAHLVAGPNPSTQIFSLRDPRNRPAVTVEIIGKSARQIKGPANHPPAAALLSKVAALLGAVGARDPGPDGWELGFVALRGRIYASLSDALATPPPGEAGSHAFMEADGAARPLLDHVIDHRPTLSAADIERLAELFAPAERLVHLSVAADEGFRLGGIEVRVVRAKLPDALCWLIMQGILPRGRTAFVAAHHQRVLRHLIAVMERHPGVLYHPTLSDVSPRPSLDAWLAWSGMRDSLMDAAARLRPAKQALLAERLASLRRISRTLTEAERAHVMRIINVTGPRLHERLLSGELV
jgi:hypothetical protein